MDKIELKHICTIRVRYAETDKMGIVYNGNYLTYFEVARTELMRYFGMPYSVFESEGFNLPVTAAGLKYHKPAYYDDVLEIHGHIEWQGEPKLKFNYEVYVNNNLITTGFTEHAFLHTEKRMPVRPPEVFKNAMISAFNNFIKDKI